MPSFAAAEEAVATVVVGVLLLPEPGTDVLALGSVLGLLAADIGEPAAADADPTVPALDQDRSAQATVGGTSSYKLGELKPWGEPAP
mmetsp:Transcript_131788/g.421861  ORF Transcript_131788/g.421861 Transcript_131788/m.421861 type:complete len:87 (-) Transcript_131788:707-967(-)